MQGLVDGQVDCRVPTSESAPKEPCPRAISTLGTRRACSALDRGRSARAELEIFPKWKTDASP